VTSGVDDVAVRTVTFEDAAHVADIVGQAGDDEMRVVIRGRVGQERPALEDVMAREGDEHRMFDIVVEGVAVADAFERKPRRERDDLGKAGVRDPEPVFHVVGQKRAKGFRRQARQRDHHGPLRWSPRQRLAVCDANSVRARFGCSMPGSP
jgi:hypothetical protein